MSGAYKCFIKKFGPDVVEDFARKHREDCQLRLAKITNGKHPDYQNEPHLTDRQDRPPGKA